MLNQTLTTEKHTTLLILYRKFHGGVEKHNVESLNKD